MFLYLDTSEKLVIGLLNEDYQWVDYFEEDIRSASSRMQGIIFDNLGRHQKTIQDIKCIFQASGPGSYTGMRVSEGLSQIFEWHSYPIYSFYHFEVPQLLGIEKGTWNANAYKGDIFLYHWDGEKEDYELIKIERLKLKEGDHLYSHYHKEPFEMINDENLTSVMIKNNPQKFFQLVENKKLRREPYYYRPLEIEFTKPKKSL